MLRSVFLATLGLAVLGTAAAAENFYVEMLDHGDSGHMVFEPAFLHIEPGDTVVFVPTDPGHNVASIDAMIPVGVDHIESAIMGEPMPVTFTEEGVYGLECTPHFGMGMVALIEVGSPDANLATATEAVGDMRGLAKRRFSELLGQVQ